MQEFARTRVGVDVYGWLHKGVFSCASKICKGIDTNRYVDFCMHRIRMLIHFNARPVLVFDGAALPMKALTHAERKEIRADALKKAMEAEAAGNIRRAEEWYQRAVSVTSEMARDVIRECRKLNIEYIVAPYEADAQLAWMIKSGYIDSVITEDSDLLVYGAPKVFYKMNKDGQGDLFESKNLSSLSTISMNNFTEDMFLYMCVCSGCDFFKGVHGLGIKKAHTIVKKYRTMSRLIMAIRHQQRRYNVSSSFTTDFARACLVFRHQTVFDMNKLENVHLTEFDNISKAKLPHGVLESLEDGSIDLLFLGSHHEPAVAKKIAEGLIHPRSLEEYSTPLDTVARPLAASHIEGTIRNHKKRKRSTQLDSTQNNNAFQLQPGTVPSHNSFSSSLNLRQRLLKSNNGAKDFNPRRVGASFRARNRANGPSSAVWASFKNSSRFKPPSSLCSGKNESATESSFGRIDEDTTGEAASSGKKTTPSDYVTNNLKFVQKKNGEIPSNQLNSEQDSDVFASSPRNAEGESGKSNLYQDIANEDDSLPFNFVDSQTRSKAASHRMEAVHRAVGRFAVTDDNKDSSRRDKFMPILKAPPSPDMESYDLFEKIDTDLSREGNDTLKHLGQASNDANENSPAVKTSFHMSTQVRRSRFFPPMAKKELTSKCDRMTLPPSRTIEREVRNDAQNSISKKSRRLKSIDHFRWSATSKAIRTKRKSS